MITCAPLAAGYQKGRKYRSITMTDNKFRLILVAFLVPNVMEITTAADDIPPPLQPPQRHLTTWPWVYFDLETTGLGRNSNITQLAAVGPMGTFSQYVMPKVPITDGASKATGITLENGVLKYNGEEVEALEPDQALRDFCTFLGEEKVLLVGHNVNRFDSQVLFQVATNLGLTDLLDQHVVGFQDTLEMFRALRPGLNSYKQEYLVRHFLNKTYNAHNALADVEALKELVDDQFPTLQPYTLSMEYLQYQGQVAANKESLRILEDRDVVSNYMLTKIAQSGLNLGHLQAAHQRDPSNGIRNLFSEITADGKPRVTTSDRIIQAVEEYFENNY